MAPHPFSVAKHFYSSVWGSGSIHAGGSGSSVQDRELLNNPRLVRLGAWHMGMGRSGCDSQQGWHHQICNVWNRFQCTDEASLKSACYSLFTTY